MFFLPVLSVQDWVFSWEKSSELSKMPQVEKAPAAKTNAKTLQHCRFWLRFD
jgi:hypothetical protein